MKWFDKEVIVIFPKVTRKVRMIGIRFGANKFFGLMIGGLQLAVR